MIGSSGGKYRTFSSNRSKIDVIHRSPNHTRGRTPCCVSSSGRVSVACSNSAIRVSRPQPLAEQERRVGTDRHLYAGDGLGGVPVRRRRRPATPACETGGSCSPPRPRSSRRGLQPLDPADVERHVLAAGGDDLLVEQPVARVGRDVVQHRVLLAGASAGCRSAPAGRRTSGPARRRAAGWPAVRARRCPSPLPSISRGATLISRLNWPSSVWNDGSARSASTSALRMAGWPSGSIRLSSSSSPVIGRSASKLKSLSIRAKTSRQRRTFRR